MVELHVSSTAGPDYCGKDPPFMQIAFEVSKEEYLPLLQIILIIAFDGQKFTWKIFSTFGRSQCSLRTKLRDAMLNIIPKVITDICTLQLDWHKIQLYILYLTTLLYFLNFMRRSFSQYITFRCWNSRYRETHSVTTRQHYDYYHLWLGGTHTVRL